MNAISADLVVLFKGVRSFGAERERGLHRSVNLRNSRLKPFQSTDSSRNLAIFLFRYILRHDLKLVIYNNFFSALLKMFSILKFIAKM